MTKSVDLILGIDLGTTKSACAIWQDGAPRILLNAEGQPITPSVIAIDPETHQPVVGQVAREIAREHPGAAIYSIKRFMGRRYNEKIVQDNLEKHQILYRVQASRYRSGGVEVLAGDVPFSPQEVSALILKKLKADAEARLGQPIRQAVITVPAYFNDAQRQATRNAGQIAGLEVRRLLNEPTAACLAYGYRELGRRRRRVAVYDLGGGTFDISILAVGRGPFSVLAVGGDTHLGGDDIDDRIVRWLIEQRDPTERLRLENDPLALARLRAAAEAAKRQLSGDDDRVRLDFPGPLGPTCGVSDWRLELTRSKLEELALQVILRTEAPCASALEGAARLVGYPGDATREQLVENMLGELEEVFLVGGQTRMPAIRRHVAQFFRRKPNTELPPEQVVALGAGVLGGILGGQAPEIPELNDVVPLSLGVEELGGVMHGLIPRNAPVPAEGVKVFSTTASNQARVRVSVFQGERPLARENTLLFTSVLSGIEPAPKGVPQIQVKLAVDEGGLLHVEAEDLVTGSKIEDVVITETVGMTPEEIEAAVQRAQELAPTDAVHVQAILQKLAEDELHLLEALLAEKAALLPPPLRIEAESLLQAAPPAEWQARYDELRRLVQQIYALEG